MQMASPLEGVQIALAGQTASGVEASDEVGLAVRGYAPVRGDGPDGPASGPVVGAVMLADPLDAPLLAQVAGSGDAPGALRLEPVETPGDGQAHAGQPVPPYCDPPDEVATATCRVQLLSPTGHPVVTLVRTVPLTEIERAHSEAQRAIWLTGGLLIVPGALGAWLLARSLAAPLAWLTAAARRVAVGDYSRPTGVPAGTDEIG
jgi:HAMP domain-containing protein